MPGEWHAHVLHVMPVRHDVHRTRSAAFLADKVVADRRPGQVLRQGIQSDVDHATIALSARALNVAGYVAVREPFGRGRREGICLSVENVVAAKPLRMICGRRRSANFQSIGDRNFRRLQCLVAVSGPLTGAQGMLTLQQLEQSVLINPLVAKEANPQAEKRLTDVLDLKKTIEQKVRAFFGAYSSVPGPYRNWRRHLQGSRNRRQIPAILFDRSYFHSRGCCLHACPEGSALRIPLGARRICG